MRPMMKRSIIWKMRFSRPTTQLCICRSEVEYRRQEQLRNKLAQAQSLMSDAAYDEAINYLEDALQQADDTALHMQIGSGVPAPGTTPQQTCPGSVADERCGL